MDGVPMFFRDGRPVSGPLDRDDKGRPAVAVPRTCGRCGGVGRSVAWQFTGYVCYDCNGSGKHKNGPASVRVYPAVKLAVMNITRDKRQAALAAKRAAIAAERALAAASRRAGFLAAHKSLIADMREFAERSEFIADVLHRSLDNASITVGQADAVRKSIAGYRERASLAAASQWIGKIGERIERQVVVESVYTFERAAFGASWLKETVYIVTMRDTDRNVIVSKGPRFAPNEGATFTDERAEREWDAETERDRRLAELEDSYADDYVEICNWG